MKLLITGGAGFIGSHLADYFLSQKHTVYVLDNLSWGKKEFIEHNLQNPQFHFINTDLLDISSLQKNFPKNIHTVFHLAANSDIMRGTTNPEIDLQNTTIATFNLLTVMKEKGITNIFYTSGSGVYGDVGHKFTSETYGPLLPISMYGATKLSAEAMISSFVHLYDMQAWIFRPANIIGPRATHGVIFDFINKLNENPQKLKILGNGSQSKSYLYIEDVIAAIDLVWNTANEQMNLFNIASTSFITVNEIAEIVINKMKLPEVKVVHTIGNRGWKGDVPIVRINSKKLNALGWKPKFTSRKAVVETVTRLLESQ